MQTKAQPDAGKVMQLTFGFVPSMAAKAALDLGLFSKLPGTVAELAAACQAHERGIRPLLYTLASLGLVRQDGERFEHTPESELFLVPSSPAYLGGMMQGMIARCADWLRLPEAVRTGTSPVGLSVQEDEGQFFVELVGPLFANNWPAAQHVAEELPGGVAKALDVGAGSAVWSLALAKKVPELKVTAADHALVLENATKKFVGKFQFSDRYEYLPGNFRTVEFGGDYDVAYLGHILHSEGDPASATLLKRLHAALKPGGTLVVAEMVASEPRDKEVFPNLFDLNMLLHTENGRVYSRSELEQMAGAAGFGDFRWVIAPAPSPILLATRR